MSHWQALRGSGPTFTGTLYSDAQAAASADAEFVPGGAADALPTPADDNIVNVTPAPTSRRRTLCLDIEGPPISNRSDPTEAAPSRAADRR
jgi:hypothetical protein